MTLQIVVNLEASRDRVREAFATVETAENKLRNTRIYALTECYKFAHECFLNHETFESLCDDAGVKKGHEAATPYLRVVKLVYGGENAASRQLQSKYAKVLDYAKFHDITASSIAGWLKKMSMENRMNDARGDIKYLEHLGRYEDAEDVQKKFEVAVRAAESKTKAVLGTTEIIIDMDAEGAPSAGYHHLAVKVGEDGSVEIVGFTNDSEVAVERSIGRSYKPKKEPKKPWIDKHPLGGLLKAINILSGSVASSIKIKKSGNSVKATPAYFTFSNTETDCSVLVSQLGVGAAPIAKTRIPAIDELPTGTFILTPENAKKLYSAARKNPELKVEVSDGSGLVDSDRLFIRGKEFQRHLWRQGHEITIGDLSVPLFVRDASTDGNRLDYEPDANAITVSITVEDVDKWLGVEQRATGFYSVKTKNGKINFTSGGTLIKVGDAKRAFGKLKKAKDDMIATVSANYVQITSGEFEVIMPSVLERDSAGGAKKGSYSHNGFTKARW